MARDNALTTRQQQEVAAAQAQRGRRVEEHEYEGKASAQVCNKALSSSVLVWRLLGRVEPEYLCCSDWHLRRQKQEDYRHQTRRQFPQRRTLSWSRQNAWSRSWNFERDWPVATGGQRETPDNGWSPSRESQPKIRDSGPPRHRGCQEVIGMLLCLIFLDLICGNLGVIRRYGLFDTGCDVTTNEIRAYHLMMAAERVL